MFRPDNKKASLYSILAFGRIQALSPKVGTSCCDVPARVSAGGTAGQTCPLCIFVPSPNAALGDGDGAARPSLPQRLH
jgi:hypothetical protein